MNRREFLRASVAVGSALTVVGAVGGAARAAGKPIRIGFIGVGARGAELLRRSLVHPDVEVPAVCDIHERNLNRALDIIEKARGRRPEGFSRGPEDYRRMLARDDFDAALIATPQEAHAAMAVDALQARKFVGSEVPACTTLEECHRLVEVQRKTGAGYMLLENYCYSKHVMQVLNMAQKGAFGDLTYAECAYIHEIRNLRFNPDGTLTWRGLNAARHIGNLYPTHAIGPVCQWLGVNRTDRLVSLVAMASKSAASHVYAAEKFGSDSAAAKTRFLNGDTNNAMIQTREGRLIEIRYDTASPRPSGMGQYALQGARGAYESAFGQHKVYMEGRSPQHAWEPLEKYESEFEHPYWAERGAEARKTGHGGGDYFVITDFLAAIRGHSERNAPGGGGKSPIDVLDAVTWSAVRPLSAASIAGGGKPVLFPDFGAT